VIDVEDEDCYIHERISDTGETLSPTCIRAAFVGCSPNKAQPNECPIALVPFGLGLNRYLVAAPKQYQATTQCKKVIAAM
jgi:hypothetical protein